MSDPIACRYCRQKIRFIVTQNGKKMPVELKPLDVTTMKVGDTFVLPHGKVVRLKDLVDLESLKGLELLEPHFANCEQPSKK